MRRLLFEKIGNAVWISHLDLMRLFQRAFKRAGLPLKHTQGFNPRPSVSIALPLSVGVESKCALIDGVRVLDCYDNGGKIRDLAYLRCLITMEFDNGCADALPQLKELLSGESVVVPKKTKNGVQDQDIIPMIKDYNLSTQDEKTLVLDTTVCCQNPTLNPMQIVEAIRLYKPDATPDFARVCRISLYDRQQAKFK